MKATIIGCGNLGSSFTKGLLKSKVFESDEITVSDLDEEKLKKMEKLGVNTAQDNKEAIENSDIVFIAVKPDLVGEILNELNLSKNKLLVSLAAGVSTKFLKQHTNARIIRVMPNICGSVLEMASAYTLGENVTEDDEELVDDILNELGLSLKVDESLMDAVTGLSGSGPAYVFIIIEALKNSGEELGLSEEDAQTMAAQTLKGASELVLESDKDLEDLVDMVCSPKGTTIEGVKILNEEKVQNALEKAVKAAAERSKELSR